MEEDKWSNQATLFAVIEPSRKQNIRALDELFEKSRIYKHTAEFKKMINFISQFPSQSPFNALLLYMQKPSTTIALTRRKWKKYNREVKSLANPMVILVPFGPVDFVFDIADTDGDPIPKELLNPFFTDGNLDKLVFLNTKGSCRKEGIRIEERPLDMGNAGEASRTGSSFKVLLNSSQTIEARYTTLAHELAHIFCGHCGINPKSWWKERMNLSKSAEELEAESVAYLVCKRQGLTPNSESYLNSYLESNSEMPNISIDSILTVAGYIESMSSKMFKPKNKRYKKKP